MAGFIKTCIIRLKFLLILLNLKNNFIQFNIIENDRYPETSSLCINSIHDNHTEKCKSENQGQLSVCEFKSTFVGLIITASTATIFEQSEILKTKHIYSDTIITKNDETLICNMGADQSEPYSYFPNEIAVISNGKIGVIDYLKTFTKV